MGVWEDIHLIACHTEASIKWADQGILKESGFIGQTIHFKTTSVYTST